MERLRTSWYLLGVLATGYAFYLLEHMGELSDKVRYETGWHFQFLTIIGLSLTFLTMAISLVKTVFPRATVLASAKEKMAVIAVGLEGVIALLYWSILSYDPKMLYADEASRIPLHVDLSLHVLPAIFLWTDFLVFSPAFDRDSSRPLLSAFTFAGTYSAWMEYCAKQNGHFPYPFFNHLSLTNRLAIYLGSTLIFLGLFYLANSIHLFMDRLRAGPSTKRKTVS